MKMVNGKPRLSFYKFLIFKIFFLFATGGFILSLNTGIRDRIYDEHDFEKKYKEILESEFEKEKFEELNKNIK
jgi:hypothetical protein